MGRVNFFVLWSVREAPRQFIRKSDRRCYQVHLPLPLPSQLIVFGLGEWKYSHTTIAVEVQVGQEAKPQKIGTLTFQTRCITWEGDWRSDLLALATEKGRRGLYGKILLTVSGEDPVSFTSSTPLDGRQQPPLCTTGPCYTGGEITPNSSSLGESVCYAELQGESTLIHESTFPVKPANWLVEKNLRRTVIGKRGHVTWSSEDQESSKEDACLISPKNRKLSWSGKLSRAGSEEETTTLIQKDCRERVGPSARWGHVMCLTDPDTAVLIGGETSDPGQCGNTLWKLEIDNDFWFPLTCSASGPALQNAHGHSATFDPGSKALYVYGGLREAQCFSDLYILDTLTWKWKRVTARGTIPELANHSATFYRKELYVFGGVQPSHCPGDKVACSNALFIYNPEFELWYQPIVEGGRPLPRYGHSTIQLSNKLIIFGGRTPATYLNDLHFLDLGFMEYTAVKSENMPPLPRGFHAALAVGDNRMLISGGCSAIGALQDLLIFNVESCVWSSLAPPLFGSKPRAGHSLLSLSGVTNPAERRGNTQCRLLVFGGSDCAGTFYNDLIKCTIEVPEN